MADYFSVKTISQPSVIPCYKCSLSSSARLIQKKTIPSILKKQSLPSIYNFNLPEFLSQVFLQISLCFHLHTFHENKRIFKKL